MKPLFEVQSILPYPVEDVFALTIDLEKAPCWHTFFSNIETQTPLPIQKGSRWKVYFQLGGHFRLEIVDFQAPQSVTFRGSSIFGIIPNFTIQFQAVSEGTHIHYFLHPDSPLFWQPLMKLAAPPYGRRELKIYFRQLENLLAG